MTTPSARDREMAGSILAKWRTWWGYLIDQYPSNVPLPDVPGVVSRLRMADELAAALAQARAEEREECAAVAEGIPGFEGEFSQDVWMTRNDIAAAIRARATEER